MVKNTFFLYLAFIYMTGAAQPGRDLLNRAKEKAKDKADNAVREKTGGINAHDGLSRNNLSIVKNRLGDRLAEFSQKLLDASTFNYAIAPVTMAS
jgi:hypothetical protein